MQQGLFLAFSNGHLLDSVRENQVHLSQPNNLGPLFHAKSTFIVSPALFLDAKREKQQTFFYVN